MIATKFHLKLKDRIVFANIRRIYWRLWNMDKISII